MYTKKYASYFCCRARFGTDLTTPSGVDAGGLGSANDHKSASAAAACSSSAGGCNGTARGARDPACTPVPCFDDHMTGVGLHYTVPLPTPPPHMPCSFCVGTVMCWSSSAVSNPSCTPVPTVCVFVYMRNPLIDASCPTSRTRHLNVLSHLA